MKLNLGCGNKKIDGYVNVDVCGSPDVVCDLSQFPWPFDSNTADEISAFHFLEHALDYEKTVLEVYRILKPGGILHFRVPHFRSPFAQWHLHKYSFSVCTCRLLCAEIPYQWGGKKLFDLKKLRINLTFTGRKIAAPLEWLANINPMVWDLAGLPITELECIAAKTM